MLTVCTKLIYACGATNVLGVSTYTQTMVIGGELVN